MFISFVDDELYMEKYGIVNSAPLNILAETEIAILCPDVYVAKYVGQSIADVTKQSETFCIITTKHKIKRPLTFFTLTCI